ncbi:sortase [Patescibacteria group bacterium]|nr:sortase [Patescibacteria group bacterium]MBU1868075.1 sortase [Patescibacteria group bacterium]
MNILLTPNIKANNEKSTSSLLPNKLIAFNRLVSTLPSAMRNLFDSFRTSFAWDNFRSLTILTLWIFLFILGTVQVIYFSSALIPLRDWFNIDILSTPAPTVREEEPINPSAGQPTPTITYPCDTNNPEPNEEPEKLTIAKIDLDLDIKLVPLKDGTWEVHDYVANYAQGTSLPNAIYGNTGLFGHDRPQAFASIKKLSYGDEIILFTKNFRFTYQVTEKLTQVDPKEVNVFYPTDKPQLTLITCDGSLSKQRYVVKTVFIKLEKKTCVSDKTMSR